MAIMSIGLIDGVQQFTDGNGVPYAGGSLTFVIVGTGTAQNVYSDPALTVSLGNIVTLNAAGRTSTSSTGLDTPVYLQQLTYDYTLKDSSGTIVYGPITVSGSQWPGQIQGQAVTSPAANANGYANRFTTTLNKAGSGTHALFAGTRFDIPTIGSGASTLTEAATVYIEGAPASGTNEYALHVAAGTSRFDGPITFSGSSLVIDQFRLTLTTGVPVTVTDVTAATTLYMSPYQGSTIYLYTGSAWQPLTSAEVSVAIPATTSQMYDVFAFNNSGALSLDLTAWTNDTSRATALALQDGIYVKSGTLTHRYVGSIRTTGVSGQTEDSELKRYLWNYYNRQMRLFQRYETTASWNYTTATVRQANGSTSNQVDMVLGVAEVPIDLTLNVVNRNSTDSVLTSYGIGEDSTTTYVVGSQLVSAAVSRSAGSVRLLKYPAIGRHFYSWNEWSTATGTTTWDAATASLGSTITSGLAGSILG